MNAAPQTTRKGNNEYLARTPDGHEIVIPVLADPMAEHYPQASDLKAIRKYYDTEGYVVVRGLIPQNLCDEALAAFQREVKTYSGPIYRQATANPERHVLTPYGYMLNPLLNIQSLNASAFPLFRQKGLEILTHENMRRTMDAIIGESSTLVQSMFFEGNPATWAHQDSYYLDSVDIGRMVGAWIAVEDIAPGAGRFFICPKSHLIDLHKNSGDFNIAFRHDEYKKLVLDVIRDNRLEYRAPALSKGDVLFWGAKTIHGSLSTSDPAASRSSFTGHFIPSSRGFLQYQTRVKPLTIRQINGLRVHCPKDQNKLLNRLVLGVEVTFPRSFQWAKKLAIRLLTR